MLVDIIHTLFSFPIRFPPLVVVGLSARSSVAWVATILMMAPMDTGAVIELTAGSRLAIPKL